ncbi:MAG: GTP cyclohydrolase I FolE [Muribaculaceae bacterium]|nr:GTP cyclohydrolase I FolE [Muribaculaceae bacterium]
MGSKIIHDEKLVEEIASHYEAILRLIGEDPEREGLRKTPVRAAKAILDVTSGYKSDPMAVARQAVFEHDGSQMVIVKDIEFYSTCEHHILPFFGKISVGYIPDGKIIGLSKLARIVDNFSKRLQVQERLTSQVCHLLEEAMPTKGVMVACEGEHLCMKMRGVEKQDSSTVTYDYCGLFCEDASLRDEFIRMIGK